MPSFFQNGCGLRGDVQLESAFSFQRAICRVRARPSVASWPGAAKFDSSTDRSDVSEVLFSHVTTILLSPKIPKHRAGKFYSRAPASATPNTLLLLVLRRERPTLWEAEIGLCF